MNAGDALMPQALNENRSGRLADMQRRGWSGRSRGLRKSELNFAVIVTIIGLLVWLSPGPARYATAKPLIGVVALIIAAFLLWRALTGFDALTEDVRSGEVRSIDGAITKRSVSSSGRSSVTAHYFDVAGQRLHVDSSSWYQSAPEAGWVRVFYLPRSHKVVNLEVLQGPAVPDVTPATAHEFVDTLRTAAHCHNEMQMAEATPSIDRWLVDQPVYERGVLGRWQSDGNHARCSETSRRLVSWQRRQAPRRRAGPIASCRGVDQRWALDHSLDNMGLTFSRVGAG